MSPYCIAILTDAFVSPQNYFLLSSSMDKTVRLWHISRRECLCCFQHIDFVTAIAFHPRVSACPILTPVTESVNEEVVMCVRSVSCRTTGIF